MEAPTYLRFANFLIMDEEDTETVINYGDASQFNREKITIHDLRKVWVSRLRLEKYWKAGHPLDFFKGFFVQQKVPISQYKNEKIRKLGEIKRIAEIRIIRDVNGKTGEDRSRDPKDCRIVLKVHDNNEEVTLEDVSSVVFKAKEFYNFHMHCAVYMNTNWPSRQFIKRKSRDLRLVDETSKKLRSQGVYDLPAFSDII